MIVLDSIRGRATSRVPIAPLINLGHAARISKMKPIEYLLDNEKYAMAQINAKRYYDYDWVWAHQFFGGVTRKEKDNVIYNGNHAVLTLEIGVKYKITDKGQPQMIKPAVSSPSELKELKIPDPNHEERTEPILLMQGEGFVCGNMRCPFTLASTFLYDLESFLMLLKTDESAALNVLDFALDYCVQYAKAQMEAGADAIYVEDPTASSTVISPEHYKKYALPYEKTLIKKIGGPVILHICGDVNAILDDMVTTGAKCISVDEVMDLAKVHRLIPVWGNVPVSLLVNGRPIDVMKACKKAVELKNRVVLSSGCVVPGNAKETNIKAMVRAVHEN